jgi:hypothetical protein
LLARAVCLMVSITVDSNQIQFFSGNAWQGKGEPQPVACGQKIAQNNSI